MFNFCKFNLIKIKKKDIYEDMKVENLQNDDKILCAVSFTYYYIHTVYYT